MGQYRKKPVVIEAITFEEFVEYGRNSEGAHIVNGMPWHFKYKGHPVTNENDQRYIIPTLEGTMNFTPKDMLITGVNGEVYPCKLDIFAQTYEEVLPCIETNEQPSDSGGRMVSELSVYGKDCNGSCEN